MNREHDREEAIDLGAASVETRGGAWSVDDHRGSLMLPDAGLAED